MNIAFRKFNGAQDWAWVNNLVGILQVQDTTGIMAYDAKTGETLGACIMDNWTANSVQCHLAVSTSMVFRHKFLEECCTFIFKSMGKLVMYGLVPSNNQKAIKLNTHMGFTEAHRLKDAFSDGVDYIIMELRAENCRFIALGAQRP